MSERVAFVTGASRGIGKATAVALAEAGFDVAIMARTLEEGEAREHSSTVKASDTSPLPGSLSSTAALVRDTGRDALIVQATCSTARRSAPRRSRVLDTWGHVDVVVHNARYIGRATWTASSTRRSSCSRNSSTATCSPSLVLNKLLLPSMIEQGGGTIVNITSASGYADPTKPAGEGGWGMGYGISKGAFQRIAGFLAVELGDQGIRCFNVQPGLIATERIAQDMAKFGIENAGAPPR